MTNEEASYILANIDRRVLNDVLDMAIKALEAQPAEDCISREAVDEYITNLLSGYLYAEERTRLEGLSAYIWELPSVQPTRPTARWIESPNGVYVECSICGSHWEKGFVEHCNMQYCPKCGARMERIA